MRPRIRAPKSEDGEVSDGGEDENVFKHVRPITYNVHKTDNEAELKALNDDNWEKLRQIQGDDQRKSYAMKAFGNVESGDPSVNRYTYPHIQLVPFNLYCCIEYFLNELTESKMLHKNLHHVCSKK